MVAITVIPGQHIYTIPSRKPARICIRLYHRSSLHCPHIACASGVSQVLPSTSLSSLSSSSSSSHAEPIRARSQIAVAVTSSLSSSSQRDHQAQACNSTRHPRADASGRCSSSLAVQTRRRSRRLRRHIDHRGVSRRGRTIGATERLHAREGRGRWLGGSRNGRHKNRSDVASSGGGTVDGGGRIGVDGSLRWGLGAGGIRTGRGVTKDGTDLLSVSRDEAGSGAVEGAAGIPRGIRITIWRAGDGAEVHARGLRQVQGGDGIQGGIGVVNGERHGDGRVGETLAGSSMTRFDDDHDALCRDCGSGRQDGCGSSCTHTEGRCWNGLVPVGLIGVCRSAVKKWVLYRGAVGVQIGIQVGEVN